MKSEYLAEVRVVMIPNYAIGLMNGGIAGQENLMPIKDVKITQSFRKNFGDIRGLVRKK